MWLIEVDIYLYKNDVSNSKMKTESVKCVTAGEKPTDDRALCEFQPIV